MIIVTVSTQRSGTKLLGNCFQNGTIVTPFGEVFNPDVPQLGSFAEFMKAQGWQKIHLGNKTVLDDFFAQFQHICNFASVDVMFNQIEIPCVSWNDGGGPYALYSYLREAGAFVISLTRDPFDSFVSAKYLSLAGGRAHRKYEEGLSHLETEAEIDEAEFIEYRDRLLWHRTTLQDDMGAYELFFELDYSELVDGVLPPRLIGAIAEVARSRGMPIDASRIQINRADIEPSGVDYASSFSNYHELRAKHGAKSSAPKIRKTA